MTGEDGVVDVKEAKDFKCKECHTMDSTTNGHCTKCGSGKIDIIEPLLGPKTDMSVGVCTENSAIKL